ncbi:MAG: dipeptidase [Syntrophobacteraceae bacterium]|jgi:acetylornithine deacetylase/succinyl-diaminopimelate desuccinylase-like protein
MLPDSISSFIKGHLDSFVTELAQFLSIPSVSTLSEHEKDILSAAEWVLDQVKRCGFTGRIYPTERHPIVLGRSPEVPGAPTLLIYGHYDVQPPDPLDEWQTPPFSPEVRDGYIYARGASDDKGQLFTYIKAIEAVLRTGQKLPLNLIILAEGEEEITSPNLEKFLMDHRDELRANAVAISDSAQFAHGIPAITYGLRGISYLQVDIRGPRVDLHSGGFGGIIYNPAQVLVDILQKLKNPDGKVALPGFYDDVLALQGWEREEMASLPVDIQALKDYLGVSELTGEPGYSMVERRTARPTLDINGLWSGFSGEGSKTIIPAKAGAKVSMRLVPNQVPEKIDQLFHQFVTANCPQGVSATVTSFNRADPVLVPRNTPAMRAAEKAIETGFGKKPVFIREGGSIPVVNMIKKHLGQENILLLGWGSPDDGAHSTNERFCIEDFHRGIRSAAALFYEMAG